MQLKIIKNLLVHAPMLKFVWLTLSALLFISSCSENETFIDPYYWKYSTPEKQNLNGGLLEQLNQKINDGGFGEIHSLLIMRNGYLVFEKYYRGYSQNQTHQIYSVTKSVTSTLIGIAIDQGKITSLDKKLLSFFQEYTSIANLDSNKQKMKLEDVLTMRSGLYWDEFTNPFSDPRNSIYKIISSSDWVKHVLDLPMVYEPGTKRTYNTGNTILLAGIIKNLYGIQANDLAQQYLFNHLGISNYKWETGAKGLTNTGWGLHLRPRDMIKFGLLYLNQGTWEKTSVISENWIGTSTKNYVYVSGGFSYGYHWWMMPLENISGHTPQPNDVSIAWGYGGQFVFVIPHLNMIVVSTANNKEGDDDQLTIKFLKDYIFKSVIN